MKQLMKAKWQEMVTYEEETGERYVCDKCGKVIVDTTQIDDKFINIHPDVNCFKIDTDKEELYGCSKTCVSGLWSQYLSSYNDREFFKFEVHSKVIRVSSIMNHYSPGENLQKWNSIKRKSEPIE